MISRTSLSLLALTLLSISAFKSKSQTSVTIDPLQLYVSIIPEQMTAADGVTYFNFDDLVIELSPSMRVNTKFAKHWGWFVQGGFTGFSKVVLYNPEVENRYYYKRDTYSRLDMTTFAGIEFWSGEPADDWIIIRQSVSTGFFLRLTESHAGLLSFGNLGFNTRTTLSVAMSEKYRLNFLSDYGMRIDTDGVMHRFGAGLGLEVVLDQ